VLIEGGNALEGQIASVAGPASKLHLESFLSLNDLGSQLKYEL